MKEEIEIQKRERKKRQSNILEWLNSQDKEDTNQNNKMSDDDQQNEMEEEVTPIPEINETKEIRKGFVIMPFTTAKGVDHKKMLKRKINDAHDLALLLLDINKKLKEDHVMGLVRHITKWEKDEEEKDMFRNFIQKTLPKMQEEALRVSERFTNAIPLLEQNIANTVSLTIDQVLCLMCNAFFGTFEGRDANKQKRDKNYAFYGYPSINFTSLYIKLKSKQYQKVQEYKMKALITYFDFMLHEYPKNKIENGRISYERRVKRQLPDFYRSSKRLCHLEIRNVGALEDYREGAMADFANKYIGGGVIGHGCVQEEIQFLIYPECIIARLFSKKLLDNEALIIRGVHRFSDYSGYGNTFKWEAPNVHLYSYIRNSDGEAETEIIAIDAVNFSYFKYPDVQYKRKYLEREMHKAYTGFSGLKSARLATGNWGCGVFGGDVQLKSLLQWLALSQINHVYTPRTMVYFAYNKNVIKEQLPLLVKVLIEQKVTVMDLYRKLLTYLPIKKKHKITVFQYIANSFSNDEKSYDLLKPLFPDH